MNNAERRVVIRKHFEAKGWTTDRWGHLKTTRYGRTYRLKLMPNVMRNEVKTPSGWLRTSSLSIKDAYTGIINL